MREASTILTAIGLAACLYFCIALHVTTGGDWRHNPFSRHLMAYTANMAVLFGIIVSARLWPDYPGRAIVTLIFYATAVGQIIFRSVLLHRAQHD